MENQFLSKILDYKRKLVERKKTFYASIKQGLSRGKHARYQLFKRMISRADKINLIAEIKKASPSKGLIREEFDLEKLAKSYLFAKVDAISVLTEDKYFLGDPEYIKKISAFADVPLLAKDFFIDEGQIYEASFNGASAILLIVACLKDEEIKNFIKLAEDLDLDCLVEVHDEQELDRALDCGAEIIGVNNRNLETFDVDLDVSISLASQIPSDKIKVAESGIHSHDDILKLQTEGFHAVLVGEAFMKANNVEEKVKELMEGEL